MKKFIEVEVKIISKNPVTGEIQYSNPRNIFFFYKDSGLWYVVSNTLAIYRHIKYLIKSL